MTTFLGMSLLLLNVVYFCERKFLRLLGLRVIFRELLLGRGNARSRGEGINMISTVSIKAFFKEK